MKKPKVLARLAAMIAIIATPATHAAEGAGTITGRILNSATHEYVRNAEVRVLGTNHVAYSEHDGSFHLADIPAGEATIAVSHSGFNTVTEKFPVTSGATVSREIQITSSASGVRLNDGTVRLDEFVVSTERDGNAKAIMEQKRSMNITNSIASDVFGDVAEGNVGEFLKNIPGIDLELTQGEIRNVRLRGLGSEYNAVTIDGVTLASADAGTVGGESSGSRSFSFDQVSLSSMDAIEVSKTVSADVDANAPAGTINLKTKRAFSREGRRISVQANLVAVDGRFSFGKSHGPDDARHSKIRPGGIFEYSDVFLDRRLGVVLSVSESNRYLDNTRTNIAWNYTATAADPRPIVPGQVTMIHSPSLNRRTTTTLTADFKATPNLILSLGLIYNHSTLNLRVNRMQLNAGTRGAIVGDDPILSFISAPNGIAITRPSVVAKPGETYTILPKFEYRRGSLLVEGRFAGSDSTSKYDPLGQMGSAQTAGDPRVTGVTFRAERSSLESGDWKVTQLAGPDIANGAFYNSPVLRANDGRYARTQVYSGDISATWKANVGLPIVWKAGIKQRTEIRDYKNQADANQYSYTGPGSGNGSWAAYNTPYKFDVSAVGASIASSSGQPAFMPSLLAIGTLLRERPADFTHVITPANFRAAYVTNTRHYEEEISAGFLMGTATFGKTMLRAGLRWEDTGTDALEPSPRTPEAVRAAGFPVSAGLATTIPGLEYQYFSNPRVHRKGSYDHFFPSASFKYKFTDHLDFHAGYSRTIRRPTVGNIAGVWVVNDDALTVNAPNPNLKPEISDNLAARVAYYFEPVGIFAFNVFQNTVKGLHLSTQQSAAEFGYTGEPDLSDYRFTSTVASAGKVVIRGMELEFSQTLSFLPGPLKGLHLRASYTRNYADIVVPLMSPHGPNMGLSYAFKRLSVYTNLIWRDNTPMNVEGTEYVRRRITTDVGGAIRLTPRFSLFLTGRNVGNEPNVSMQKIGANPAVPLIYEVTGALWTFGVKGVF